MQTLGFILAGLLSGILSGFFGIGGGILLVPILVYGFSFDQHEAQGTTLAAMVPPIGLFAAIKYYLDGHMRLDAVPGIIIGFAVGAYLGAACAPYLAGVWLRRGFGLLLCYLGIDFLLAGTMQSRFWPAAALTALLGWLSAKRWRRSSSPPAPDASASPQDYVL